MRLQSLAATASAVLLHSSAVADATCVLVRPTHQSRGVPLVDGRRLSDSVHELGCADEGVQYASSLVAARDIVRTARLTGDVGLRDAVDIVLLPGRHSLTSTGALELTTIDSHTTWRAAIAGTASVSASEAITGWGPCPPGMSLSSSAAAAVCARVDFVNASALAQPRHLFAPDLNSTDGQLRRVARAASSAAVLTAFQQPAAVDLNKYSVEASANPEVAAWLAAGPQNHADIEMVYTCLLYTSPSPRDRG